MGHRLNTRNRTEVDLGILSKGGLLDLFDNQIKTLYSLTDEEFDYICENASEDQIAILLKDPNLDYTINKKEYVSLTFTERRQIIITLDSLMESFNKSKNEK